MRTASKLKPNSTEVPKQHARLLISIFSLILPIHATIMKLQHYEIRHSILGARLANNFALIKAQTHVCPRKQ